MSSRRAARQDLLPILMAAVALAVGVVAAVLIAHARDKPARAEPARFVPSPTQTPPFRLRDQNGRVMSPAAARGKVLVLTFLYSTCRDLCPAQAAEIKQAVLNVGVKGVEVYGVSVDPVGDTQARVRAWIRRMGLVGAPVHFLIGTRRELEPVWREYGIIPITATPAEAAEYAASFSFRGIRAFQPLTREPPKAAREPFPSSHDNRYRGRPRHHMGAAFEHTAYVMVIDKHGIQRVGFPFEQLRADRLALDLRALLRQR